MMSESTTTTSKIKINEALKSLTNTGKSSKCYLGFRKKIGLIRYDIKISASLGKQESRVSDSFLADLGGNENVSLRRYCLQYSRSGWQGEERGIKKFN